MKQVAIVVMISWAAFANGCSDDGAARPVSSGSSGQASSGLSLAYTSKCSRCHGSVATGQGRYPSLPGTLDAATYVATVRSGRKEMPMFGADDISDADLAADYEWMKTKR